MEKDFYEFDVMNNVIKNDIKDNAVSNVARKIKPISLKHPEFSLWSFEKIPLKRIIGVQSYAEYQLYLKQGTCENETWSDVLDETSKLLNAASDGQFSTDTHVYNQLKYLPAKKLTENKDFHKIGRIYNGNSLQTVKRDVRYILLKDQNYVDLDIKNAHPVILHTFAKENNIIVLELSRYVDHRESYLEELSTKHNIKNPKNMF